MLVVVVSRLVTYGWCDRVGDLKVREMSLWQGSLGHSLRDS